MKEHFSILDSEAKTSPTRGKHYVIIVRNYKLVTLFFRTIKHAKKWSKANKKSVHIARGREHVLYSWIRGEWMKFPTATPWVERWVKGMLSPDLAPSELPIKRAVEIECFAVAKRHKVKHG